MEVPIQPEVRTAAPREPQPRRQVQGNSGALLHPLLVLVVLTLITNFACTVARFALVVKLDAYWNEGVPTLCHGAVSALPYGTLDAATAFMFEAISNAIAVQTYENNPMDMCHTPDYSLGLSNSVIQSTHAYLIAIGAFDLVGTIFIQGFCWWRLFARRCKLYIFRWSLASSLIFLGLDAAAIYESSLTDSPKILGLSAVILTCTLVIFVLTLCILQSRLNRSKFQEDDLEIPDAIFTRQPAPSSTGPNPNVFKEFAPRIP